MNRIGTTATGTIIVEVSEQEYSALLQLRGNDQKAVAGNADGSGSSSEMSHAERASYVAERLKKLAPKKKDGVVRSIEAMFQFNGGIDAKEIERLLVTLQERKVLAITADGKISYGRS